MLWPLPQHRLSQLSMPGLVLLQIRPCVPAESDPRSRSQKSGDFSKYTSSLTLGRRRCEWWWWWWLFWWWWWWWLWWLWWLLWLLWWEWSSCPVFRLWALMSVAMWKRSLRIEPTSRNSGVTCQQVFSWQLPDVPWHLHFLLMWSSTTWETHRHKQTQVEWGSEQRWGSEGEAEKNEWLSWSLDLFFFFFRMCFYTVHHVAISIYSFNQATVLLGKTHNIRDTYWSRIEGARWRGSVVKYSDIK